MRLQAPAQDAAPWPDAEGTAVGVRGSSACALLFFEWFVFIAGYMWGTGLSWRKFW